jgi:predicted CXXCH cytochrome family protein
VWDKGKNTVLIEGLNAGKVLQTVSTEIYFNPSGDRSDVPKDFTDSRFHTVEKEKICTPCHDMSPPGGTAAAQPPGKSPCAACHSKLVKVKVPHEPALNFSCVHCHSKLENPRYGTKGRDSVSCAECHADKTEEVKKNSFSHGPVAAGYCELCHDPHGSEFPGSLKAPINEVCLSCHEKVGKAPHVSRDSTGKGHPVSGKDDISPKRKGKELSCASCHDPHGGVVRFFLVSKKDERMALCQYCHAK